MSSCLKSQFWLSSQNCNILSLHESALRSRLVLRWSESRPSQGGAVAHHAVFGSLDHLARQAFSHQLKNARLPGCHAGQSQDLPVSERNQLFLFVRKEQKVSVELTATHGCERIRPRINCS